MAESDLNIVFAASADALVMVEGEATFVPEDVIIDALEWGRKEIQPLVEAQVKLRELAGKAKMAFTPQEDDAACSPASKSLPPEPASKPPCACRKDGPQGRPQAS